MINFDVYLLLGLLLAAVAAIKYNKIVLFYILLYWGLITYSVFHPSIFDFNSVISWSKILAINISFNNDNLAKIFVFLISAIGCLVFLYSDYYCDNNKAKAKKLFSILQLFAISMLGLVLSDNVIVLFLFWELTTVTSYLLIQFSRTDSAANQAAFNSIFLSVASALLMLVGFVILYGLTNTWSLTEMALFQKSLSPSFLSITACVLIIIGAIVKSAQFPTQFWLSGAMKAPTPVSAYLHSATMVNAGIFLLARIHPIFADYAVWKILLSSIGLTTMFIGGLISLFHRDMKSILAYTTIYALGSMVYMLASNSDLIIEAFVAFLFFHALYKAAAFMLVGIIDKNYNTRDILELSGIAKNFAPISILLFLTFIAMAGLPPFFGFILKELIYEAKSMPASFSLVSMSVSMISSTLIAAASLKMLFYLFIHKENKQQPLSKSYSLLFPGILVIGFIAFSFGYIYIVNLLSNIADIIIGAAEQPRSLFDISASTGRILNAFTLLGGLLAALILFKSKTILSYPEKYSAKTIFEQIVNAILVIGNKLTTMTQEKSLSSHIGIIFVSLGLFLFCLLLQQPFQAWQALHQLLNMYSIGNMIILAFLAISSIGLVIFKPFLTNLFYLAILGLVLTLFFILQGAPDVAMTQLLVEILIVVVLVVALRKADFNYIQESKFAIFIKLTIALFIGALFSVITLLLENHPFNNVISDYYINNSYSLGQGMNVVNVILVDFRAFDTFGEVLVVATAAIGIWLLVKKFHKERIS